MRDVDCGYCGGMSRIGETCVNCGAPLRASQPTTVAHWLPITREAIGGYVPLRAFANYEAAIPDAPLLVSDRSTAHGHS